jgi:hypothetical protein
MRQRAVGRDRAATAGIAFGRHRPRIHPTAFLTVGTYVIGRVTVGARASIWFGAVLRGDFEPIRVGEESLIAPPSKPLDQAGRAIDLPSLGAAAEEAVERFSREVLVVHAHVSRTPPRIPSAPAHPQKVPRAHAGVPLGLGLGDPVPRSPPTAPTRGPGSEGAGRPDTPARRPCFADVQSMGRAINRKGGNPRQPTQETHILASFSDLRRHGPGVAWVPTQSSG